MGSGAAAHRLSCSAASVILPDQGSNPCLPHWQAHSLPQSHQGSPHMHFLSSELSWKTVYPFNRSRGWLGKGHTALKTTGFTRGSWLPIFCPSTFCISNNYWTWSSTFFLLDLFSPGLLVLLLSPNLHAFNAFCTSSLLYSILAHPRFSWIEEKW